MTVLVTAMVYAMVLTAAAMMVTELVMLVGVGGDDGHRDARM